jgi:hypothetical protein
MARTHPGRQSGAAFKGGSQDIDESKREGGKLVKISDVMQKNRP